MYSRLSDLIDAFRPADGPPPQSLARFMRWALRGAERGLGVAAIASAMAGTADVVSALLLGRVVDAIASGQGGGLADHGFLIAAFIGFFLLLRPVIMGLSTAASNVIIAPNVMPLVLSRLHRWTMGQAVGFFDNDFAGRIAQKQMQTARAITDVASEIVNVVTFALASMIGSALLLAGIDGWTTLLLLLWVMAWLALVRFFMPRIRARSKGRASARAMVTGQVVDTITNIKTVKLFAHAAHEDRAALSAMAGFRDKALDFGKISTRFRWSLMTLAGVLPVLLIGAAVMMWRAGSASPGDVAAAGTVALRLSQMTGWVSMALMSMWGAIGEVEDGMHSLTPTYALSDAPDAATMQDVRGAIRFEAAGFAYGRAEGGVSGIDLEIAPGERVGIVGASGAGKSTLVALLLRLYDVETGAIRIDGQDLRKVTQESLRRQIAMVTQETAMFNRSARDNIRYGNPEASDAQVEAAARAAEAHDFITAMQDHEGRRGYDAYLGERGVKLSGGQRQRIALARAFLKDAPILVLDEATSALDSEVEAAIQDALNRVMAGKTVLAIAHRLSTIAALDRIIVLEQGRIVESGRHADLLAQGGLYARYWARQSGGFLGTDADVVSSDTASG